MKNKKVTIAHGIHFIHQISILKTQDDQIPKTEPVNQK